jgi:hypothetical protein
LDGQECVHEQIGEPAYQKSHHRIFPTGVNKYNNLPENCRGGMLLIFALYLNSGMVWILSGVLPGEDALNKPGLGREAG